MAVASQKCTAPLIVKGAQCVSKSYPDFWEIFKGLDGIYQEV